MRPRLRRAGLAVSAVIGASVSSFARHHCITRGLWGLCSERSEKRRIKARARSSVYVACYKACNATRFTEWPRTCWRFRQHSAAWTGNYRALCSEVRGRARESDLSILVFIYCKNFSTHCFVYPVDITQPSGFLQSAESRVPCSYGTCWFAPLKLPGTRCPWRRHVWAAERRYASVNTQD